MSHATGPRTPPPSHQRRLDVAFGAFAVTSGGAVALNVLNALQSSASALDEMLRGVIMLLAMLAIPVGLVLTVLPRRPASLVALAALTLGFVTVLFLERRLSPGLVTTLAWVYGLAGLALGARWFLVERRAGGTGGQ